MFCRGPTIERGIKESDGGGVGGRGRQAIDAVEWHLFFRAPGLQFYSTPLCRCPNKWQTFFFGDTTSEIVQVTYVKTAK